ncbi:MAG: GTP cyclohydrolase II [Rhodospirillales bacterium]|nr:GTP cyclohydrolase II [Rhodospirillales bacterium]
MNQVKLRGPAAPRPPSPPPAGAEALRLRGVHRGVADLRRGTPVLLDAAEPLVLLAAETAGARGLAEFAALAAGPAVLLLAPVRAAAVLRRPVEQGVAAVALPLPHALLEPARLRSLADPTAEELLPSDPPAPVPAPAAAAAALGLGKLARLLPAVLAAPVAGDAGARAARLDLLRVVAADVLAYPDVMAAELVRVAEAEVPLADAPDARVVAFRGPDAGIEHLAILIGRPEQTRAPLARIHSECFTGDLLGSLRCDCGAQLRGAIRRIAEDGAGAVLYLAQEGRGIGLVNKLRAYALQDRGLDTVDANRALGWGADERRFLIAATMLRELGLDRVRLLTNNPDKVAALAACGIAVAREPHAFAPNGVNDRYLATKAARFGHLFDEA